MKSETLLILGLLALFLVILLPTPAQTADPEPIILNETVVQTAVSWQSSGSGFGYSLSDEGLRADGLGGTAVYQSPTHTAPFPFNALVPSWLAETPEGTELEIHLRTANTAEEWSDWYDIHAHDDWNLEENPETTGDMIVVQAPDDTHQYIQYRLIFSREAGADPILLRQLSLTFINSTDGPTLEEMLAKQTALDAVQSPQSLDSYPRPPVISRSVWCIYADCNYSSGIYYSPATHVVVHHTVSSNSSTNWAAVVRAIWNYHTNTQGWGDIGYNYLVDRTGVIYEGHLNANYLNLDVIGTHAAAANAGSMGVALIGTFTTPDEYSVSDVPPPAMLNALADLAAWKVDQRNIAIYDASRLVNMNWGLPHIMGHRDVYGGMNTLCPGGNVQTLLPWLRQAVTNRLGQVSPYTFVSETSSAFSRSNNSWSTAGRYCGWQGNAYYTWTVRTPNPSTHWGEWRLTIPQAGRYEIQAYAPYCLTNRAETDGAAYQIIRGGVTSTSIVSHDDNVGLWMSLGEFDLPAGPNTVLRLTNQTATDSGLGIWFDDVRFRRINDVTITGLAPNGNPWLNNRAVTFSWQFDNSSAVQQTTLEAATDADFANIVASQSWPTAVTNHTHPFTQDYPLLYWRVTAQTAAGLTLSPTATFRLDATPPTSSVSELRHHVMAGYYDVLWQGEDALSGLTGYTIAYRAEGEANWTTWLTNVMGTTAVFTPPNPAAIYWFRSQAADAAGNAEPPGNGDIRTDQATIIFNPAAQNSAPAPASWQGSLAVPFAWELSEISDPLQSTITAASDAAFTQIVISKTISGPATSHVLTFTQEYAALYWRVTVDFSPPLPGLTSTVTSAPTRFGLDVTPPESGITAVYTIPLSTPTYLITWGGQDNLSGIATYHIEYQADGDIGWTRWLTDTTQRSAIFSPPDPATIYHFRSQATDRAGNLEPPHPTADASTDQAITLPYAIMLPIISR
jgi:hypothetical protein